MRVDMSPEDELCLLLARGQLPPEGEERALGLLESPLHWDLLLERAHEHQVFPLLYHNLRSLEFHGVPDAVRGELREAFRMNALRNAFLAGELSSSASAPERVRGARGSAERGNPGRVALW